MLVLCKEDLKPPDHQMVLGNFNGHLCIQGKIRILSEMIVCSFPTWYHKMFTKLNDYKEYVS